MSKNASCAVQGVRAFAVAHPDRLLLVLGATSLPERRCVTS